MSKRISNGNEKHSVRLNRLRAIYERHQNGETYDAIGKSIGASNTIVCRYCADYLKLSSYDEQAKLSEQLSDSSQHSIYVLDLNTVTHQTLAKAGIKTVGDIREWIKSEYTVARFGPKSLVEIHKALAEKYKYMNNRLLLGSGSWHWENWTTIDAAAVNEPDFVATIPPLPDAVKAQTWDEIMMIHAIEHIAPWKALELSKECYACLRDGGVFILEQPNILYAAKVLLGIITPPEGEPGQYSYWPLFGDPTTKDELMLHRWGYTPATLTAMLVEAGFSEQKIVVKTTEFHGSRERDFRIEAMK